MGSRSLGILLLWLVAICGPIYGSGCGSGCVNPNASGELPPPGTVASYSGTWQYRYGTSPQRADGSFAWADPSHDDGQWQVTSQRLNPPGRKGRDQLWLRTQLAGPAVANAAFLVDAVYHSCTVYLDGQKVSQLGQLDGPRAAHFPGRRTLTIPLSVPYSGKRLVFQIYSPQKQIGLGLDCRLGGRAALIADLVRRGLSPIIMGLIFVIIAFPLLVVSSIRWGQTEYLLFGCAFLTTGIYITSRSSMHSFLFEEPALWYHLELASLTLCMLFATALQHRTLGMGPLGILRWSWRALLGFFVGSVLLLLVGAVHIETLLTPLQVLVFGATLGMVVSTWTEIRRGNLDARIMGIGLLISGFFITAELVQLWEWIPRLAVTDQYAAVAFLGSIGVILGRRFHAFNQRLTDYSTVLQLSFSSAQDLTPGQQAQIALTELLRMLRAQRGLLFLCEPDGSELQLVAGRDAMGKVLRDPTADSGHDQRLVDAVVQKRRPFVRELTPAPDSHAEARRSAVAAPLLARGQLLGVIYLEGGAGSPGFGREDVEILLGLVSQIALTLMATRAGKLERESAAARQRLSEQAALLQAAARMARGDLKSPIAVDPASELGPLAQRLDQMRLDLQAKIELLESGSAAVRQLNEELRVQLDQRLRRLLDFAQQKELGTPSDPATRSSAAGFIAGELLGEHYRVISLLGEGTSGSVYEVKRTTDGRVLAAKVINKRADKTAALRFAREAQILSRLNHPNVVAIVDVDLTADGMLFLVMELVRGTPLSHCLERFGDQRFALAVLRQIAAGLCTVHEQGIIHRDLKPANVLVAAADGQVDGRPLVKLVDFGVSMPSLGPALDGSRSSWPMSDLVQDSLASLDPANAPDALVGTPMYLAPELAANARNAGPASDIFSFGIIAYELLSGEMPFVVPPVVSLWRGEPLPRPQLHSKSADDPLAESVLTLVELCLLPEPELRPTAAQILSVLTAEPT